MSETKNERKESNLVLFVFVILFSNFFSLLINQTLRLDHFTFPFWGDFSVAAASIVMDDSLSPKLDTEEVSELKSETHASKRRKVVEKTVVKVKIGEKPGKLKNEGPPSDLWSWRKYGQKPIKGSPYPRGYYKCSTSKGCLAKKQVERCRTDASMLIITYTSSHNHPCPDLHTISLTKQTKEQQNHQANESEEHPTSPPTQEQPPQEQSEEKVVEEEKLNETIITTSVEDSEGDHFHYLQSPISCPQDIIISQDDPFTVNLEKTHETLNFLVDEEPLSYQSIMTFSTPKSEENDFFDELEELPTSSVFTSFMRSNDHFDERIPVVPS